MSYTVSGTSIIDIGYLSQLTLGNIIREERQNFKNLTKLVYSNGTDANEVNQHYYLYDTLTAASGTMDIDLSSVNNNMNPVLGFSRVKFFFLRNLATQHANIVLRSAPSNGWIVPGDDEAWKRKVGPSGREVFDCPIDGFAVVTANGTIRLTHDGPSSDDISFELLVLGLS